MKFFLKIAAAVLITALITAVLMGCSSLGVQPWERKVLAQPQMSMTAEQLDAAFDDHIYFSKEGSSGGRGFAGGGCGCN